MKEKMLSIVIPCYNEEIRIQSTVSKVDEYMKNLVNSQTQKNVMVDYEIIVVNDGSKDGSAQRLAEIKLEHFRFISNAVNGGKGSVIKDGFKAAEGEYVLFMDADLATDLSAIKKALAVFEEQSFCAVVGSRKHRQSHIEGEDK